MNAALLPEAPDFTLEDFKKIEDIPVVLSAELDRRHITIRELLRLKIDSLLTLTRPTGENIEIYIGDVPLASAEILVVDSTLAVRIADLRDKGSAGAITHTVHHDQPDGGRAAKGIGTPHE